MTKALWILTLRYKDGKLSLLTFSEREPAYLFLNYHAKDLDLWQDEESSTFETLVRCGQFDVADVVASRLALEWDVFHIADLATDLTAVRI